MKLKFVCTGVSFYVFDPIGRELLNVQDLSWRFHQGTSYVRIKVTQPDIEIAPSAPYLSVPPVPASGNDFELKVIGDGTWGGTSVVDSTTMAEIESVAGLNWEYDHDMGETVLILEFVDADIEIKTSSQSVVPTTITGSYSSKPPSFINTYPANINSNGTLSIPMPADPLLPPDDPFDAPVPKATFCQHEWVNASFTGLKLVCKHCNEEKQ